MTHTLHHHASTITFLKEGLTEGKAWPIFYWIPLVSNGSVARNRLWDFFFLFTSYAGLIASCVQTSSAASTILLFSLNIFLGQNCKKFLFMSWSIVNHMKPLMCCTTYLSSKLLRKTLSQQKILQVLTQTVIISKRRVFNSITWKIILFLPMVMKAELS